jgi:hypothetical protein
VKDERRSNVKDYNYYLNDFSSNDGHKYSYDMNFVERNKFYFKVLNCFKFRQMQLNDLLLGYFIFIKPIKYDNVAFGRVFLDKN